MIHRILLIALLFSFFQSIVFAQISFEKVPDSLLDLSNTNSGLPLIASDINGDMLDDIVYLEQGNAMHIALQKPDGGFIRKFIRQIGSEAQWSLAAADFNGNGRSEIVVGGTAGARIVALDSRMEFESIRTLPGTAFFVQTMSAGDFNGDGWVDLFLCNDNGTPVLLKNKEGTLQELSIPWIDFNTDPPSDNSGNYGSVFSDIDRDGDMDLYIVKCRANVPDPQDPRRVNVLYEHLSDSSYVERAADYGLASGAQSWTGDFGDCDGDGDLDALITNHGGPNQFMINENGYFIDTTEDSGLLPLDFPLQGVFADFDSDMGLDVLITGHEHGMFRNLGAGIFEPVPFGDGNDVSSFAIGDLNGDGRPDLYCTHTSGFVEPSPIQDDLWFNVEKESNWLRIHLEGRKGNRDAVGASVELFGPFGTLYREVRAGEGYGIMNSTSLHFGLGDQLEVDSMLVHWPDGSTERHSEVYINTMYYLAKESCLTEAITLPGANRIPLCTGDSVVIEAPQAASYSWNSGDSSRSISIGETGLYHLTLTDGAGCRHIAGPVHVFDPREGELRIPYEGALRFCASDSAVLSAGEVQYEVLWSNGSGTDQIVLTDTDWYYYDLLTPCGPVRSDSIYFEIFPSDVPEVRGDTLDEPGPAELTARGGTVYWYRDITGQMPIAIGDTLKLDYIDTDSTFFAEGRYVYPGNSYRLGETEHEGSKFNSDQYAGHLEFTLQAPLYIDSLTVYSDTPAPRVIQILRDGGTEIYRDTFMIDTGRNRLYLDAYLDSPGSYIISTDEQFNTKIFGSVSPRLYRTKDRTNFPYRIERLISIDRSSGGGDYYYYFYDWRLRETDLICSSERVPVSVEFLTDVERIHSRETGLRLFPNPAHGQVEVVLDGILSADPMHIRLFDLTGTVRLRRKWQGEDRQVIGLRSLPPGSYFIQLLFEDGGRWTQALILKPTH